MKKTEMLQTLKLQYKNTNKEIEKLDIQLNKKRDMLIKLEGAIEALEALDSEDSTPTKPAADHTEAAMALGVFK